MISFDHVGKRFGESVAVADLSLEISEGEIVMLLGPSGCGKTTSLKMINRLVEHTSGTITVDGRDISTVEPVQLRRSIGYVIQQSGLFPHMTIADNVATVPRLLGWNKARIRERVG
ncbi:MAG: ATP-binding cassette domain-containing protein, partial [Candidatus Dormibacteraeota bacterium]|nr:ATP-binding cassette domain-containing protein [Candidatus Dormibacteraeota bacterium]